MSVDGKRRSAAETPSLMPLIWSRSMRVAVSGDHWSRSRPAGSWPAATARWWKFVDLQSPLML